MNKVLVFVLLIAIGIAMVSIVKKAEASDGPYIGDATCGVLNNQTIEDFSGFVEDDLCGIGSPQGHAPDKTETGWTWACYDFNGHKNISCSATQKPVELPKGQPVVEIPEEVEPEIEPSPSVEVVAEPVRTIPAPVITPAPEKKKSNGPSGKRNKHEVFEHECQIDRDDATWDYSRRSRSEIKERCRAEVAICPIRSQR